MWCLAARGLAKDRAHPGPPTPCRVASECMDTPEVGLPRTHDRPCGRACAWQTDCACRRSLGADDESRPRGPDRHVAWRGRALPTELHPQRCKTDHRPVPRSSCGNLLKSIHRCRWWRSIDRRACANAQAVRRDKEKGPEPFGLRACSEQVLKGARLGAPFSRIQRTLAPIKAIARRNGPAHRRRRKRRDERDQPLQGSVGPNGVVRFHDDVLWFWWWLLRAGFSMGADCKDSLPNSSTPCENGV